jgi:proteasome lid subunit RPN8/RPN11
MDMLRHAQAEKPNECCGLLAGKNEPDGFVKYVTHSYPLVNELARPTAYRSEPRSILAAYKDIDRRGLDVVGVYHSHPTVPPNPSNTDLANNSLGDQVVHVIISLTTDPPTLKAWRLFETNYEAAEWELV